MAKGRPDLSLLEAELGYGFTDRALLERALTHVSTAKTRVESFQRLEFLGDRVLGLAIADILFQAHPDATEGELSRRLATAVRRESCATVASAWQVEKFVRLGAGERRTGGAFKTTLLSDVCEALIAAVYLDGGFSAARALVERAFASMIGGGDVARRDAKSTLQEWSLARGLGLPTYTIITQTGTAHAPAFTIAVAVADLATAEGAGGSKRVAEQNAAQAFLTRERAEAQQ